MLVHTSARIALAAIFAYQGLVPKLLAHNVDELTLIQEAGVPAALTSIVVRVLGLSELGFAALLLVKWRQRWPVTCWVPISRGFIRRFSAASASRASMASRQSDTA